MVFMQNFYSVKLSKKNLNITKTRYLVLKIRFSAPTRYSILKSCAQTHHYATSIASCNFYKYRPNTNHLCNSGPLLGSSSLLSNLRRLTSARPALGYFTLFYSWSTYAHYTYLLLRIRYGARSPSDLHHKNNNIIRHVPIAVNIIYYYYILKSDVAFASLLSNARLARFPCSTYPYINAWPTAVHRLIVIVMPRGRPVDRQVQLRKRTNTQETCRE